MKACEPLLCLQPKVMVKRACQEMRANKSSAALILDVDEKLIGIFTGRDAVHRVLAEGRDGAKVCVSDVMTKDPITITPHATPIEALRIMWDGGFRHLPVMDRGALVGMLLRRNFKAEDFARLDEERELWEHMR